MARGMSGEAAREHLAPHHLPRSAFAPTRRIAVAITYNPRLAALREELSKPNNGIGPNIRTADWLHASAGRSFACWRSGFSGEYRPLRA